MRRYTKNELTKRRIITCSAAAILLLIAILLPFLPDIFPLPTREELIKTDVVIEKLRVHSYFRGPDGHSILASDGKEYYLSGSYDYDEIKEVLVPGATAAVRWYKRLLPLSPQAEEISVEGVTIVSFDNDKPVARGGLILISIALAAVAVFLFVFGMLWNRHIQRLQDMRDRRIDKKYKK